VNDAEKKTDTGGVLMGRICRSRTRVGSRRPRKDRGRKNRGAFPAVPDRRSDGQAKAGLTGRCHRRRRLS